MDERYLSEKHKKDLYDSGLDDEIIKEIGFYTASKEISNGLLDRRDINCECLVIPYSTSPEFYRLKPDGIVLGRDGKPAKYLQKANSESRLFIHPYVKDKLFSFNGDGADLPLLFVEGEKKLLKATKELYFEEPIFYPVGISGVWNWRKTIVVETKKGSVNKPVPIKDLEELHIDNRLVYICFDSDIVVNEQVQEAENELGKYLSGCGAIRVCCIRIPHEEFKLGIDDYLVKYGRDKFKELIEQATSSGIVKYNIKFLRKLPGYTVADKTDLIVSLIIKDLRQAGGFYYDNNGSYYYNKVSKKLLNIQEEAYEMDIANEYGLYRESHEFKDSISKLEEHAIFHGKKISIKNVSYFDTETNQVVLYDNLGSILFISAKIGNEVAPQIEQTFNGYRNIFFKHRDYEPIRYINNCENYFKKYILDICNFQTSEFTQLTPDQQKFLFQVWFYSLFFPNLLPTKPILVMTGDYGSGKSTIQRLVGKLLFGNSFNVSTLQNEKDFLSSVIHKYYLVYDNVDINEPWIRNAIASLSTGFKVEVRKLYTTMEMFQADPISYLAMNSMGQGLYQRPDIANRLLIFRTRRLPEFIPEHILTKNILDNRNEILSETFDNLSNIIKYVDDKYSYVGTFRMADFANLGYKIAMAFGREQEFKLILDIMSQEQATLPLEDNPLVDYIDKWLNKGMTAKYISTGDLYAEFKKISEAEKLFFPFKTSISLGRALQMAQENLKHLFTVSCKRAGGNKTVWTIGFKE